MTCTPRPLVCSTPTPSHSTQSLGPACPLRGEEEKWGDGKQMSISVLCPWASHCPSLGLCFPICRMGVGPGQLRVAVSCFSLCSFSVAFSSSRTGLCPSSGSHGSPSACRASPSHPSSFSGPLPLFILSQAWASLSHCGPCRQSRGQACPCPLALGHLC